MWNDVFRMLLARLNEVGDIKNISMNETYGSVNVTVGGNDYLLTIMKEDEKK